MLLLGLVLGLALGLLAGGRLENLAAVRLRWLGLLFAAVVVRFGTEVAIQRGLLPEPTLRIPLLALGSVGLVAALWANRRLPGMAVALVGILLNAVAILVNGGAMPVWEPSLRAAGFTTADLDALHILLASPLDVRFLLQAGPIGDVIPLPLPILRNVLSIGDVVLGLGLASFLFASLVREPEESDDGEEGPLSAPEVLPGIAIAALRPLGAGGQVTAERPARRVPLVAARTGLASAFDAAVALERPAVLGGSGLGLTSVGSGGVRVGVAADQGELLGERVRRHPYVRLALDGRFSALWVGQLVSLFGDRLHQIALAFLVLGVTGSPLAVALVFVAATLPNLLLGPIAGTFVDRWDRKRVLVVSDLLRAATVLVIPAAASLNVYLVYPLVFVLTSVSIFFRPARAAILPELVEEEDLLTANSAMWVGETLADVIGYPVAGLFVAFIGTAALPLAFWLDGASYLVSALLIGAIAIPRLVGGEAGAEVEGEAEEGSAGAAGEVDAESGFRAELVAGIRFLRSESVLLVNTAQGVVGQIANGALVALAPVYAQRVLTSSPVDPAAAYALMETGIGAGSLVGGFVIGLIGARLPKGPTVAIGYAVWGLAMAGLALTDALPVAVALMVVLGVANMASVIPSQTLFQERTPAELIGRVVGSRFSLVFGATTLSMAAGGLAGEGIGIAPVLGLLGLVAALGGLAGLLVPSTRRA